MLSDQVINNQSVYDIDLANVFVMGESAGAFIALGVGYLDYEDEKPITLSSFRY